MKAKNLIIAFMAVLVILPGCGNWSNTGKGTAIGSGIGAVVGSAVGTIIGKDAKTAGIGAAIGAAVGAGTGAIIGKQMDKKAEELSQIEGAQVETVIDTNDLQAIKVTFDSGILFPFNSFTLTDASKASLEQFAAQMKDMPETDITIQGHTDDRGTRQVNEEYSLKRAQAVADYLTAHQMNADRFTIEGKAFDCPVASNDTEEGRALNRRVEIYITANENMIKEAEAQAAEE